MRSGDSHLIVPFSETSLLSLDFRFMSSFNCDNPKSQMLIFPASFTNTLVACRVSFNIVKHDAASSLRE
jgi:hypothetical protein